MAESIEDQVWEVLIAGTGLQESLLALALSRSNRKILHVDQNGLYGGSEAAFSLQEVESWVEEHKIDSAQGHFRNVSIEAQGPSSDDASSPHEKLSFPRAYSIALAPQIVYTSSALLPSLVASRVDQQLDFLAVGSWYVLETSPTSKIPRGSEESDKGSPTRPTLFRIPANREDILNSDTLSRRSKQLLTKFLRFLAAYDTPEQYDTWSSYAEKPFHDFLADHFDLSEDVQRPIQALVLSTLPSKDVTTRYALDRIARHVGSMGLFGEGFSAVIPKWGGLAEVAQVGCRACAVGGGTYMLGDGLEEVDHQHNDGLTSVRLEKGETVQTQRLACGPESAPKQSPTALTTSDAEQPQQIVSRSVIIVASPLDSLFAPVAEPGPVPAVAVIAVPISALKAQAPSADLSDLVYIMVHSSDTGECPKGQCILYASLGIVKSSESMGAELVQQAVDLFLESQVLTRQEHQLWKLSYEQPGVSGDSTTLKQTDTTIIFPPSPTDLAFDDSVLDRVKEAWEAITAGNADRGTFLSFERREQETADDEETL